jgi:hypothetical protein
MEAWVSRVVLSLSQFTSAEEVSLDEVQAHVCRHCQRCEDRPTTTTVTRAQADQILRDHSSSRGHIPSLPDSSSKTLDVALINHRDDDHE